ncbi:MAG: flavin reductase family protein [Deltaproteobacteria bacterium]|nr:flavin reductase family protein [Deltaproteobacteria bacterium]
MEKIEVSVERLYYPMPCSLVGANVGGKANFLTVAWFTMANPKPPCVLVTLNKAHYTNVGILENGTFSVNIPSTAMVDKVDYCGLVSGRKVDKSTLFETFYGKLKTAPMIKDCPFSVECKLIQTVDLHQEQLFIGEIKAAYSEERYLTDGTPDLEKLNPLLLIQPRKMYAAVGPDVAPAWQVGKGLL